MTNDFKDKLVAQVNQHNKELQNIVNPPSFYSRNDVENLSAYAWTSFAELVQRLDQPYHCVVSRSMVGTLSVDPLFYRYFTPVSNHSTLVRGLLGVLKVSDNLLIPVLTDAYARLEEQIFDRVVDSGFYILVPQDRQKPLE